jgi:quinol-cytochrome oxidoreductase complex cytochrome b subunit
MMARQKGNEKNPPCPPLVKGGKGGFDKKFYPDYLFEILVITVITVETALILALLFPPDIGRKIDFNAIYQPMPEWYFLWLYELVKYFPGKWIIIGTTLLPLAIFVLVALAPFLDKTPDISLRKRWRTALVAAVFLISAVILTIRAL